MSIRYREDRMSKDYPESTKVQLPYLFWIFVLLSVLRILVPLEWWWLPVCDHLQVSELVQKMFELPSSNPRVEYLRWAQNDRKFSLCLSTATYIQGIFCIGSRGGRSPLTPVFPFKFVCIEAVYIHIRVNLFTRPRLRWVSQQLSASSRPHCCHMRNLQPLGKIPRKIPVMIRYLQSFYPWLVLLNWNLSHIRQYCKIPIITNGAYFRNKQPKWVLIFTGCLLMGCFN